MEKMLVLLLSLLLFCCSSQAKDYTVVVETWDGFKASTDATVKIKVYGTIRNVNAREIRGRFEQGSIDTIRFSDHDIGSVTGMAVWRNNNGFFPDWRLDKITIKTAGQPDSIFNYYNWVPAYSWRELSLSCPNGYTVNSQRYCADLDECQDSSRCVSPAECVNTAGSFYCRCPSGYSMKPGTLNQCADIDECGNNPCDYVKSTCENLAGSYRCICRQGYKNLDAQTCINANECTMGTDSCDKVSSACVDTEGNYYCRCKTGYTQGANNKICVETDECGNNPCDLVKSTCENLAGSYRCICRQGYKNLDAQTCINENECAMGTDSCDKASSECVDTEGDYFCRCKTGYTQGANNKICEAILCSPLSTPAGGTLEPARCTQANSNIYGDKCFMKCKDGYVIDDIQHGNLTCGSSGMWDRNMGFCFRECASYIDMEPVGISDGRIANSSFSASSHYFNYPPWKARLNSGSENAWYATPSDWTPWIQVDLGIPTVVLAVATQGKRFSLYVKTYQLGFSNDGKTWTMYEEGGQVKVFVGNSDYFRVATRKLNSKIIARFIRIYPQTWNHGIALKFELYTCKRLT